MKAGSCPHCGHPIGTDREEQIARHLDDLREWATERAVWVGPGEDVSEQTAAAMLGRQPNTLRGWRGTDGRLPSHKVAGRVRYRLHDIATFLMEAAGEC